MTNVRIVNANTEIMRRHYGHDLDRTVRAVAVVDGERVLGIGGVFMDRGCQVVFGSFGDELRARPKWLLRAWRKLRDVVASTGVRAYAYADEAESKVAGRFLEHLGFAHLQDGIYELRERS